MNARSKLHDLTGSLLIALLLGASLTLSLLEALGIPAALGPVALVCGLTALVCAVASYNRYSLAAALLAALGIGAVLLFMGLRPWEDVAALGRALVALGTGGEFMLTEHAQTIAGLLSFVLTLTAFLMSRLNGGIYPALTLSVIVLLGGWFFKRNLNVWHAIPALAALAALFARAHDDEIPYLRTLPTAIVAALLALLLVPAGNLTYPPLQEGAEKVRQLFYDYFMFTDPRTSYSVRTDGYQPEGDALGGPAEPLEHPVMLVESDLDFPLLLRGSVKRSYTTSSWVDTAINNRFLFIDPTKRGIRDAIFDANRPQSYPVDGVMFENHIQVTMLGEGTSTLFVPHRLKELETAFDLAAYYNNSGEVFITRSVQAGDRYQLVADVPEPSMVNMESLLAALEGAEDAQYSTVVREYTQLPQGIERGVYQLVEELTGQVSTSFQKAMVLQHWLQNNCTYNLEVDFPPRNRDFVSYFVLDSREGYCTYYASAMAVMARMAGLPSRYIEGYMATPGPDGSVEVTGRNAHAWAEIYFKGFGWLAFNPTPGDDIGPSMGEESPQDQSPPEELPPDEEDEPAEEDQPEDPPEDPPLEETPEPEPEPTPTPTPPPPEGTPDDQPPEEDPDDTPILPPDPSARSLTWLWILLAVLALAAAGAGVTMRILRTDPARMSRRVRSNEVQLLVWYRALLLVLQQQGQMPLAGESPLQFASRLVDASLAPESFRAVAQQVMHSRYARQEPDGLVFEQAAGAYRELVKQLKPLEHLRWLLSRLTGGLGSLEQIP